LVVWPSTYPIRLFTRTVSSGLPPSTKTLAFALGVNGFMDPLLKSTASVAYCPSMVELAPVHMLVLFLFFFVHLRNSETALWRQVSNIVDYFPHLLIAERPFPCRHS